MEGILLFLFTLVLLFLLIFLFRIPVSFALAIAGFIGIAFSINIKAALTLVTTELWVNLTSYNLGSIPFFVLLGNICFYSGISKRLYYASYVWFGHIKGGIGIATVLACAGFSSICGSNAATAATMSSIALPEMRKYGYDLRFSAGTIATASTLGVLIPPSIVLIVVGLYTGQSISKLFIAAIIPGIITTLIFALTTYIIACKNPTWTPKATPSSWKERIRVLPELFEISLLFLFMILGMHKGWFSATEAGAAGSVFAILIAYTMKGFSYKNLILALKDTVKTSCMIIFIVIGAIIYGKFLALSQIPQNLATYLSTTQLPGWVVMFLIAILFIIGGAIMDALGFLLLTLPVVFPIAENFNYDPVWYSVFLTLLTTFGAITPPVGINVFVVSSLCKDLSINDVFKGTYYYVPAFIVIICILIFFPEIATFLAK